MLGSLISVAARRETQWSLAAPLCSFAPTDRSCVRVVVSSPPSLSPPLPSFPMSPELEAVSSQIGLVALIALASALGQTRSGERQRSAAKGRGRQSINETLLTTMDCCCAVVVAAIFAVYVRDVYAARRRRAALKRTSIGADRAAALRMWKEDEADVNKVYLIAPSPFQTWTSHYSHPRSELTPSFHSAADEQRMRELLTPSKDWWAGHREGTAQNTQDSLQKLDFGEAPQIVDNSDLAAAAAETDTPQRPSRVVANGRKSSSRSSRNSRSAAAATAETESLTHAVTETVTKTISRVLSKTLSSSSRTSRSSRNSRASLRQQQQEEEEEQKAQAAPEPEPEAEAEVEEEEAAEPARADSPEPEPPLSQEEEAALSSSDSDSDDDEDKSHPASSSAAAAAAASPNSDDRDFEAGGGVGDDEDSDVEPASYPEGINGYRSSDSPPRGSSPQRSERSPDDYSHLQSPGPADRSADGEDGDSVLSPSRDSRVSRGGRRSSGTPGRHRRQWTHTVLPGIIEPRIHRKGQGGSRW